MSSISDAKNLQSHSEKIVDWCLEKYDLSINISKFVHISFHHRHNSRINLKFRINNVEIFQMHKVRRLSIIYSNDLNFNAHHIDSVCTKALGVLGFMKSNCTEFKVIKCFTTLYRMHSLDLY